MRKKIILFLALFPMLHVSAQSWEIFNTRLKAEKLNGEVKISFVDGSNAVNLACDTAYYDGTSERVFFRTGGITGVLDPSSLEVLQPPLFKSLQVIDGQHCIVEVPDGFYFSYRDFPLTPVSLRFEDIYPLIPLQLQVCGQENPFVVLLKGKAGLVFPQLGYDRLVVAADYDEILYQGCEEGNLVYYLREGNKWGAGGCEGVEVKPMFEKIEHVFGDCGNNGFFIWHKDRMGLIMSGQKDALIPTEYDRLRYLTIDGNGFIFCLNGNHTERFLVVDSYGEIYTDCSFEHVIKVMELNKSYMVYTVDGEQLQLELNDEEVHQLEFTVEDWIYLGY